MSLSISEKEALRVSMQPKMSIAHAAAFLNVSSQYVHKLLKDKNIICPKFGNKCYLTFSQAKQLFNISFKQKVIVGHIIKGGVGKTTTIDNVASCANTYGAKILKIDMDPQGNLTTACGIDPEHHPVVIDIIKGEATLEETIIPLFEGMDLIPGRIENGILDNIIVTETLPLHTFYADLLEPIAHNYDFILIDCPPTMGQAVTAASLYADVILSPLNPEKFSSVNGLRMLRNEVEALNKKFKTNISYKVFLNKYSSKTLLSDKAIVSLLADPELEGRILQTAVQFSQEIPNITDTNHNLFSSLKKLSPREDFDRLTRELLEIVPSPQRKANEEGLSVETNATANI